MTPDTDAAPVPEVDDRVRDWPVRAPYEGLLWFLAGAVIAVVLTWPLLTHLTTVIPHDAADPLAQVWVAAWGGHALLDAPLSLFNGNTFWPEGPSYAFSDDLLGYFPAALVGSGPVAALARYNLLFLFTYSLAFAGAGLLAREIGARPAAAAVAGAAFAWAPWRMGHNGHLNILSTGGIPLALFLLLSGYRRGRVWQIVAGWLVAAWQVSLGFGLGIYFCYLLALFAAIAGVEWLRRGRPRPSREWVVGTAAGGSAFLAVVGVCVAPYLEVLRRYPDAPRSADEVAFYSPPLGSFLSADVTSRVWGKATEAARADLPWAPEQALFPGLLVCLLAVLGLLHSRSSVRLRIALVVSLAVGVLLSMGMRPLNGNLTYRPLYEVLPGWTGLRTPGRLAVFWSLALALLAALGTERLADWLRSPGTAVTRQLTVATTAVGVVCSAVVLWEGSPKLPLVPVPAAPPGLAGITEPQVHFPASPFDDDVYMLWSTDGFPRMANGNASYLPPGLATVRALTAFPDPASVQFLRSRGYRTVVLHTDRAIGTPWADAAQRPVDGLGVTVRQVGTLAVYDLVAP